MIENIKNMSKIEKIDSEYDLVDNKKFIAGILSLFFSIAFAWFLIPIITNFIDPPMIDMAEIRNLFMPSQIGWMHPEPVERTMFVTGVFLLPALLLIFISFFNYIFKNITYLPLTKLIYNVLAIVFLSLVAYLAWVSNVKNNFIYFASDNNKLFKIIFFSAIISLLINLLILNQQKNNIPKILLKITSYLAISICWIIILYWVLLDTYGISLVSDMGTYNGHFDSVFYSAVQVFLGKEILYDFLSQYGLYPHILEPIFRIIGLSVFKFTLIMSLLLGISLVLLYKIFKKLIDDKIVGYLGFIASIWVICMYGVVLAMHRCKPAEIDAYFQFYPIRLLFPFFSIYFTYYYLKTSNKTIYYLSFIIYSISILWNFDTGFVIYLTWLIILIYEGLCDRNIKIIIFHLINWILIFLLTIGLFTLYMYLRYGHMPMYNAFLYYQKMYYLSGYAMMPMPLIHQWNFVIIIYLIGLIISINNLLRGERSLKVSIIFNLSILGVGMFSYYQGRSHDFNLPPISYPAVILITIFADDLLKRVRNHKSILHFVALNYITFFMLFSAISLISNYEIFYTTLRERVAISIKGENTPIIRTAEFIKNNTKRGEEILLLSNLSGIYCLESGTTSPLKSEPAHINTTSDERDALNYLSSNLCKKVFLDLNFKEKTFWDFVQTNFKLSLLSPDKNIGMFIKLEAGGLPAAGIH